MVLKRLFKEPTSFTLFIATILAIFEAINSAGYSDNIAISLGLIDSTPVAGEKITSPGGVNLDIWGPLKVGTLDYAILAFQQENLIPAEIALHLQYISLYK